jgi:rRNA maturation protein Rpf1
VPRGAKTVKALASLAKSLGHTRVLIVNSLAGQPKELRFLDVAEGWQWLDARIELGEVKLQRDLGQKVKLEMVKIYAEGQHAQNLANFLGGSSGLPIVDKLSGTGAVARITSDDDLKLQFHLRPNSETVGPVLRITSFGWLHGEGGAG